MTVPAGSSAQLTCELPADDHHVTWKFIPADDRDETVTLTTFDHRVFIPFLYCVTVECHNNNNSIYIRYR